MEKLIPFTISDLAKVTNHRSGEVKFGEKMLTVPKGENCHDYLKKCDAQYVLFGIPEDVGIRANYGRPGASSAWKSAISSIANIQHNRFCKGSQIVIIGQLDVSEEMEAAKDLDFHTPSDRKQLSELVEKIDKGVIHIISCIIKCGKTPIGIGGGHNNPYGNLKG